MRRVVDVCKMFLVYFSFLIYSFGFLGVLLNRDSLLRTLLCLELMLVGLNFGVVLGSLVVDCIDSLVISLFILTVIGVETSVGLGLMVGYYRVWGSIGLSGLVLLQG